MIRSAGCIILLILSFHVIAPNHVFSQHLGFYVENKGRKARIPFELYNNLIVVQAILNNEYPVNLILDTGVRPTILLEKQFADSVGLEYQRRVDLFGVGDAAPVEASVVTGVSLSMNNIQSTNLSMLVLENDLLQLERHLGVRIDGILGYDLFSRFVVKINYQKKLIDFYEPSEFVRPPKFRQLDIEIIESKPMIVMDIMQRNGVPLRANLLIDTGASHALILNPLSEEKIQIPDKHIYANLGRSISGELKGILGRVDYIKFGKYELDDVIVSYIEEASEEDNRNGSIGGELLSKFSVIFDYYHQKMYLESNYSFRVPFEYNMSGLEFIAEGLELDNFFIHSIRQGSPSYNIGLLPGDQLVAINNIGEEKLSLSKIYAELSSKEGKEISLTVRRGGIYLTKTFYLKREI
jgi:predicted aspartyl protease